VTAPSQASVGDPFRPSDRRDTGLRVLVAAVIDHAGRVLVLREEDEPYRKQWVVPQGDPRPGEALPVAVAREVREELGLEVHIASLLGVYEDLRPEDSEHWIFIGYRCRLLDRSTPRPSREAIDFAWVRPPARTLLAPPVVRRMLADAAGVASNPV